MSVRYVYGRERLASAIAEAEVARGLGMGDDSQSRSALAGLLRRRGINTSHFRHARLSIPEAALRDAVPQATQSAP